MSDSGDSHRGGGRRHGPWSGDTLRRVPLDYVGVFPVPVWRADYIKITHTRCGLPRRLEDERSHVGGVRCPALFDGVGAMAQSPGAFEIGGFGRFSFFADTLGLDHHFGGGGWLAFYPARNLAIEGEAAYTKTKIISTATRCPNIPDPRPADLQHSAGGLRQARSKSGPATFATCFGKITLQRQTA